MHDHPKPHPRNESEITHAVGGDGRFIARELSWLAFNRRVLEEAQDPANPLIERAKFLAITSSNLDEFVMVRLAELCSMAGDDSREGRCAHQLLNPVRTEISRLVQGQYTCWMIDVAPLLAGEGFAIVGPRDWDDLDRESLRSYYQDQLEPVLTPLAVDPARPFPLIANRGICVAVALVQDSQLPSTMHERKNAVVVVPGGPRLISLTSKEGTYALLEDVILTFLDRLFPGHRVCARCLFRPTRDGSLDIDEEDTEDLISEIEAELSSRDHGRVIRLEVEAHGDRELRTWLIERLAVETDSVVSVPGPLDLTFLFQVAGKLPDRADLLDLPLTPELYPGEEDWEDPFARLRDSDLLLHHPYQSFQRVVELLERAAEDPAVLAIKQTLYRTSGSSPIAKALMRAAKTGKQVTVLVELKARFDEAANIKWARALEEAGAHVVYGLVGYKVHAKLLMIIRRDEDGIRRYVHLGTGNYNERTAKLYTDLSYLTCNEAVGRDVAALFNMITGYSQPPEWERLAVSPLTMRETFVAWLRREADHAKNGRQARVIAKFNALVDVDLCEELYAASQAGVRIDLIVRGMCILRAGVKGLSDGITVRSIIGRFLEHSRIFWFANAGDHVVAIASADWMTRNLDRRVESLVRIEDPDLRERLKLLLDIALEDNSQARMMTATGAYVRLKPSRGQKARSTQAMHLEETRKASVIPFKKRAPTLAFKPRRKRG